ncbi:barstar family protein [Kitasatospora sp. NPDC088346]|uniref:barstar family protein n=1 Tax=Kitasatospora sp. NPDC088346 TaxID=3364073 RepID=UPI0038018E8B
MQSTFSWEWAIPATYALVGDGGHDELWGLCAGVTGLFVDPPPPLRERLVFHGMAPAGPLLDLPPPAGTGDVPLGDLFLDVRNAEQPESVTEWWGLSDVVVTGHAPSTADAALVDLVVEATVQEPGWGPGRLPVRPLLVLRNGSDEELGTCIRISGLFGVRRPEPPVVPMELTGCAPREPLRVALDDTGTAHEVQLWALDRSGRPMSRHELPLHITGARASSVGAGLIDITLARGVPDPPSPAARPVRDAWYEQAPRRVNHWAQYGPDGRREWLRLAFDQTAGRRIGGRSEDRSGGTFHLDGRFVTDLPGLHCAIGEAVSGPGGYFGKDLHALDDCLYGGFGAAPPFTLVLHGWGGAQQNLLTEHVSGPGPSDPSVESVLELLRRHRVEVVLQGGGQVPPR